VTLSSFFFFFIVTLTLEAVLKNPKLAVYNIIPKP